MPPTEASGAAMLEFQIACELPQARIAGERLRLFLKRENWPEMHCIDAELALVEACNNAILYAEGSAKCLPVRIRATLENMQLTVEVVDHTPGFEWPVKAALPDPEAESGRGVFLIQSVMDRAEYMRSQDHNTLVMTKKNDRDGGSSGNTASDEALQE